MGKSLFDPVEIRSFRMENRVVAVPMATRSFTVDGRPTDKTMEMYGKYAESRAGMVVVEHHAVHPWGRNRREQPRLYGDADAESLRPLTDLFRAAGTPVVAQINFAGSMTADENLLREDDFEYVSPSGVKTPRDALRERPRPLEERQIAAIVEAFVRAAERAVRIAGYDGVQIHAAHGYLLGQFLSPLTNKREDAYGRTPKGRARLLYEIVDAVRSCCKDALLSVRLGMADHMPDEPMRGLSVDDTADVARELAALGGDYLSLSGNHCGFGDKRVGDDAYFAPFARVVRGAVRGALPTDCAGGVRSRRTAEELLAGGVCDLVGIGRPFWSEPGFLRTWRD